MTKLSRRSFLKGVGVAAAASAVPNWATSLLAQSGTYQGKVTIYSVADPVRSEPLIKAIAATFPGVEADWRQFLSERFVELFSGAELAGDQIDIVDLNGQDLRRYAVAGKLMDLSATPYLDRFRPVGLETYSLDNKLFALPRGGIAGFTFLFNKKLFDQIGMTAGPATYDDLLKAKPELEKLGASVFTQAGKNIYLWPVWQFWAYAQTSGNKAIENTVKTLQGEMKFTDPEHVAALEILYRFVQDGMFSRDVLSLDNDSAQLQFFQGTAAMYYWGPWAIPAYRDQEANLENFEMSLTPPVLAVPDTNIIRQLPGGTGSALGIYADISPERLEIARGIIDLLTSDTWVEWDNKDQGAPVSCNANVQASNDPLAVLYGETCAPNQFTYLDWLWPPEITRTFQEQQQAIVAGVTKPDQAAKAIQDVMDGLFLDGYEFN